MTRWLIAALLACACTSRSPRVTFYDLRDRSLTGQCLDESGPVLAIAPFRASSSVPGNELIMRSLDGAIEPYLYHRWLAPAPYLVTDVFADVLSGSGRFERVVVEDVPADADLLVQARIERFEGVRRHNAPSTARVAMVVVARDRASGRTVSHRLVTEIDVGESSIDALVDALREGVVAIAEDAGRRLAHFSGASREPSARCRPDADTPVTTRR